MIPKILIVEDSLTARQFVREALQRFHCELVEAESALDGLAAAQSIVPDVILLDIGLEGMDGSEMLARLRMDPVLRKVPVVAFTSQGNRDAVLKMARLGVRDYLIKPLKEDLLCERLGRIVNLVPRDAPAPVARLFEDRLKLLVIDDKPGVHKVLSEGLESTGWEILSRTSLPEGLETWKTEPVDVVLLSTSIPGGENPESAAVLKAVRSARPIPVIALVPALSAASPQNWMSLENFDGACNKPIVCEELKGLLARVLKLDRAARFFEVKHGILFVHCPHGADGALGDDVLKAASQKLREASDAGVTKLAMDLLHLKKTEPKLLRVVVGIIDMCRQIGFETAVIASENVVTQCSRYEEAQRWTFYNTIEAIMAAWTEPVAATT